MFSQPMTCEKFSQPSVVSMSFLTCSRSSAKALSRPSVPRLWYHGGTTTCMNVLLAVYGYWAMPMSMPSLRARSMVSRCLREFPQFLRPRSLKWVTRIRMPVSRPMWMTSSNASAMWSASLRICTSRMPS